MSIWCVLTENCELCKQYKKTPARPVVSLPLATELNEIVAVEGIETQRIYSASR